MEDGLSMYFFLPDEVTHNLTLIEEALTAEFVQDLSNTLHAVQVLLTLPVIKFGYSNDLLPSLSDLGKTKPPFQFFLLVCHFIIFLYNWSLSPLFVLLCQACLNGWQRHTL